MKDIKTFLIGFLTCTCMFLTMGQTEGNDQMEHVMKMVNQMKGSGLMPEPTGKYQGFADKGELYLVNTITGQLFYEKKGRKEKIWQQMIKPKNLYGDPIRP